ncbi:MAG: transporter substrate-binding domain-containing protein [Chloroflexota bacterium]
MNVKRLNLLLLMLIFLLLVTSCGAQGDTWARVAEARVLRVGIDPTFPPFEVVDENGNPFGLDVDLLRAVAADLGVEAHFVYFGYDGLYDALLTGQVDVLASALVVVPERRKDFAYSDSYFNAGEILLVPAASEITGMADLNGRSLAVELGAYGHVEATTWAKRLPSLTVLPFSSPQEALTAVAEGQADAGLVDSVSGRLFLRDEPRLRRAAEPVTVEPYALVVRVDDQLLLQKLNESLARLEANDTLNEIVRRWVGE